MKQRTTSWRRPPAREEKLGGTALVARRRSRRLSTRLRAHDHPAASPCWGNGSHRSRRGSSALRDRAQTWYPTSSRLEVMPRIGYPVRPASAPSVRPRSCASTAALKRPLPRDSSQPRRSSFASIARLRPWTRRRPCRHCAIKGHLGQGVVALAREWQLNQASRAIAGIGGKGFKVRSHAGRRHLRYAWSPTPRAIDALRGLGNDHPCRRCWEGRGSRTIARHFLASLPSRATSILNHGPPPSRSALLLQLALMRLLVLHDLSQLAVDPA